MILVGGKAVACDATVVKLWTETGLHFAALGKRTQTTAVVLHWTGSTNLGPGVFETLRTRKDKATGKVLGLSVHFAIDPDGTVYQFCDATDRCAHAGSHDDDNRDGVRVSGNAASVGIEIVNPASSVPDPHVQRAMVREEIHGDEQVATAFTAPQLASSIALTRSLCAAYGLPLDVPMAGGDVLATVMAEDAFRSFRGVCGHLHITRRKRDPGLAILRAVAALTRRPSTPPDIV